MPDQTEAEAAINALNGGDYQGNRMQIRFKTPKVQLSSQVASLMFLVCECGI